jgi:hypothetical protein
VDSESSIFPLLICRRFTNKNHLSYLAMASDVMSPHTLTFWTFRELAAPHALGRASLELPEWYLTVSWGKEQRRIRGLKSINLKKRN